MLLLRSVLDRVRTKISLAAAGVDQFAIRGASALKSWLLWPLCLSAAVGSGLWALRNEPKLATLETNKLSEVDRNHILVAIAIVLGALALLCTFAAVARRIATREWRTLETVVSLNKWLFVLFTVPIVAALHLKDVEQTSPKLTLFLAAVAAALSLVTFYQWPTLALSDPDPDASARRKNLGRALRAIAPLGVLALWIFYGWFFSRLSITNHHALVSRTIDLGYYDNIFYQSIHGHPLGCSFIKAGYHGSAHFDPILVLVSPLYLLYPHAEFLLVLQSVWLGAGVVPIYLLTKAKTGSRYAGLLLGAAYVLYPALHGCNLYEFHSLTLITPVVLWLVYFFERGATKRYYLTLAILLLCREDVALLMCFVGLYEVLTRRKDGMRMGWITILASVVYFGIVKAFFMTSSGIFMTGKDSYSFAYYYDSLIPNHTGVAGIIVSILTNPIFTVKTALEEPKIVFLILLFLPLALLPFIVRRGRVMLAYGLLFCLLASKPAVCSIAFQYSAVLIPFAFALTPLALRQVEDADLVARVGLDGRRFSRALLGGVIVASVLVSWKFGALVDNASFRGGFQRVTRTLTDEQVKTYEWVRHATGLIPPDASVGVTNRVGPHASNRKNVFFYPDPEHDKLDYVFIDEAELKAPELEKHNKAVAAKQLVEVTRHDKLVLLKRP